MSKEILAKVNRIAANGVVVELADGQSAWLPEYEIVLDSDVDIDLEAECPIGSQFPVIICDREVGGSKRFIVSKARVEFDPWTETVNWNEGEVKQMKVKVVTSSKVYGPIKPGIEGVVSTTESKKHFGARYGNHCNIYAGDFLMGRITEIAQDTRLVHLDIVSYESDVEARKFDVSKIFSIERDDDVQTGYQYDADIFPVGIDSMLVVDDDPLFLNPVCDYFREHMNEVFGVETYEKAKQLIFAFPKKGLDLALIDLNLFGSRKHDLKGLEIARFLAEEYPDCPIVLVTGERNFTEEKLEAGDDLEVVEFLRKPLGVIKLREMLLNALRKKPKTLREFIMPQRSQRKDAARLYQERDKRDSLRDVEQILKELKDEIGAEVSILFSIHPVTSQVEIIASSKNFSIVQWLFKKLRFSPVRDVAIDEEIILEREASSRYARGKHLWLRRSIPYESCIGVPVLGGGGLAYSMFLLHPEARKFSSSELLKVQSAAVRIGDFLQRKNYLDTARKDKRFAVAGMTYSSLGHELSTILSGADADIRNIMETVGELNSLDSEKCDKIRICINRLTKQYKRAIEIYETFRQISRPEESKSLCTWTCIMAAANLAQKEMQEYKARLIPQEPIEELKIARTKAEETGLQQVFLNLFLNSSQQMEQYSCQPREVAVALNEVEREDGKWLQVLVSDTGPGIHKYDWERIFEPGVTSRPEGTGMGLHICRDTIKRLGGIVRVTQSILFVGTTFEVLFPML